MNPLELSSQTTATNERGMSRRCQATVNNLTIEANVGSILLMTGTWNLNTSSHWRIEKTHGKQHIPPTNSHLTFCLCSFFIAVHPSCCNALISIYFTSVSPWDHLRYVNNRQMYGWTDGWTDRRCLLWSNTLDVSLLGNWHINEDSKVARLHNKCSFWWNYFSYFGVVLWKRDFVLLCMFLG